MFIEWNEETSAQNATIQVLKAGGGRIQWLPGTYDISQPIEVWDGKNITMEGMPGTVLRFPEAPEELAFLASDLVDGATQMEVTNPAAINLYWRYQLYAGDESGDRLLEFRVTAIEGNTLSIHPAIRFMDHVKRVPKGCILVTRNNFFEFNRCQDITVRGFELDGRNLGNVAGHTTYCGIIGAGLTAADKRPRSHGLTISHCSFLNLKGRGIAIYHTDGVLIQNCHFQGIAAQALEMDHFSSGALEHNLIEDSGAGIALNDAFDTRVTRNTIRNCSQPIALYRHFPQDWVNTGHRITGNWLEPRPGSPAVIFRQPMTGNRIERNHMAHCTKPNWVINGEGNTVSGNIPISTE